MQIIVVVGHICSGKTTYASRYPSDFDKIEISSIVKKLTQSSDRVRDESLDEAIIEELRSELNQRGLGSKIVITGVRQLSIMRWLEEYANQYEWVELKTIVLQVPNELLKKRYEKRNDKRDQETFEEAVRKDSVLGLSNLLIYLESRDATVFIQNYNKSELLLR